MSTWNYFYISAAVIAGILSPVILWRALQAAAAVLWIVAGGVWEFIDNKKHANLDWCVESIKPVPNPSMVRITLRSIPPHRHIEFAVDKDFIEKADEQ